MPRLVRARPGGWILASVADPRHGRIVVELEVDEGDALLGTVALDGGEALPFSGWIGLFAALEGQVGSVREAASGPSSAAAGTRTPR